MASTEKCPHCGTKVGRYDQKCAECGKGLSGAALLASSYIPLSNDQAVRARQSASGAAKFFWIVAIIGAVLGGLQFVGSMASATGSPQQAAGAAMGCALAIIPYVIARAVDELTR
jgi:hypothetical protein